MDIHRVTDAVIIFCSIRFSEQASINKSIGKYSKELVVQLDTRKKGNEIICKSFGGPSEKVQGRKYFIVIWKNGIGRVSVYTRYDAVYSDDVRSVKTMQSSTRNHSNSRVPVSSSSDRSRRIPLVLQFWLDDNLTRFRRVFTVEKTHREATRKRVR